jgi:hypothetical protein
MAFSFSSVEHSAAPGGEQAASALAASAFVE